MFRNYFKTAFRNLLRETTGTLLNLAGLTLGITCSIILILIISYHSSFDNFHSKRDRIYRVVYKGLSNGQVQYQSGVPSPLRDAFAMDFPEAEEVTFTSYRAGALITVPRANKDVAKFREESGVVFAEPSFFRIFDRLLITGDFDKALDQPNEAVISERLANKYFGNTDVTGKVVEFEGSEYSISAVMENPPSNTDFPFDLMLSYITIKDQREQQGWYSIWSDEHCYFLLEDGEDIQRVSERIPAFTRKYRDNEQDKGEFQVYPLSELHFDSRFETFSYQTVPRPVLFILGVIAGILILTACINFINLATADAIKRSREVGIRKTMGSTRAELIFQFLGETTLITSIAVILSLGITQIALGFVNPFLELNLFMDFTGSWHLPLFLVLITLFVSLFSGFYPALVVSSYSPVLALKNKIANRTSGGYYLRSALVVFQFFISQFFIIGTIVLIRQTDFFIQMDLGFDKEAILLIPMPDDREKNREKLAWNREKLAWKRKTLKDEVANIPGVERVTLGSSAPFSGEVNKTIFRIQDDATDYATQYKQVDDQYLQVFNIDLLAGRNLTDADTLNSFLVNESFLRLGGFSAPDEIIGKMISMYGKEYPVVGVVKDFNTASLKNKIEPTVLFNHARGYKTMAMKVTLPKAAEVIAAVKAHWEKAYPDHLFDYSFMEENIRSFYDGQKKMTQLLTVFTSIAIFIGCLGLFGLVSFMTNQKTKEIGVRKVLGASVENILISFSWSYVKLIVIGFMLAIPLGFFAMQQFLNEFAYQIPLSPWIFLIAFLVTIGIALLTVGFKSFRAAMADPVKSLRYE